MCAVYTNNASRTTDHMRDSPKFIPYAHAFMHALGNITYFFRENIGELIPNEKQ